MSTSNPSTAATGGGGGQLIVHHLNNSRSQRLLWLLEELQLPYEIKYYQRTAAQLAPPELKRIHPLGKAPVLQDGNRIIAETAVIIQYLIDKYDTKNQLKAKTEEDQLNNIYWVHASEGSIMPYLTFTAVLQGIDSQAPWLIRPIARAITHNVRSKFTEPSLKSYFTYIEDYLKQQKTPSFLAGNNLTASDFMISFALETGEQRYPQFVGETTRAYIKSIHERAAYKRALEKGGEYAYAKM